MLIVDDDPFVRQALTQFVNTSPDLTVVGSAGDGAAAVKLVDKLKPAVVLMDVQMPDVDGIAATHALRAAHPEVRVLMLTAFAGHDTVDLAVRAGASGFLPKTAKPAEVVNAIRLVARGHGVLPVTELDRRRADATPAPGEAVDLTRREREVLAALIRGLSNREIAAELQLAESTVKLHLSTLMAKLGVTSRVQALVRAHQLGLRAQ